MSKNDGGMAFPGTRQEWMPHPVNAFADATYPGMSLRDYFAGQALAAMEGFKPSYSGVEADFDKFENVTRGCYKLADAMLAERAK